MEFKEAIDNFETKEKELKSSMDDLKKFLSEREKAEKTSQTIKTSINKIVKNYNAIHSRILHEKQESEKVKNSIKSGDEDLIIEKYVVDEVKNKYPNIVQNCARQSIGSNTDEYESIAKNMDNEVFINICENINNGKIIKLPKSKKKLDCGSIILLFFLGNFLLYVIAIVAAMFIEYPGTRPIILILVCTVIYIIISKMRARDNFEKFAAIAYVFRHNDISGLRLLAKKIYTNEMNAYHLALKNAIEEKKQNAENNKLTLADSDLIPDNLCVKYYSEYKFMDKVLTVMKNAKLGNDEFSDIFSQKSIEIEELNGKYTRELQELNNKLNDNENNLIIIRNNIEAEKNKFNNIILEINNQFKSENYEEPQIVENRERDKNDILPKKLYVGYTTMMEKIDGATYEINKPLLVDSDKPFIVVYNSSNNESKEMSQAYYSIVDNMLTYIFTHMFYKAYEFCIIDNKGIARNAVENMPINGNSFNEFSDHNLLKFINNGESDFIEKVMNINEKLLNASDIVEANKKTIGDNMIKYSFICYRIYSERDIKLDNIHSLLNNCKGSGIFTFLFIDKKTFEDNIDKLKLPINELNKGKFYYLDVENKPQDASLLKIYKLNDDGTYKDANQRA